MWESKSATKIRHVLCPTDLSERSQTALGFAARLAETLHASLTACHCAPATWFTAENRLPKEEHERIKTAIKDRITACEDSNSSLTWQSLVIENSFDPARDILDLARESNVDLIVMKARPGVLSAFRFGSIVERVVEGSDCPVLLLPSRFLAEHDPAAENLQFRRVLFDYDFSQATDHLFRIANALTRDYHAELEMLSVLEPTHSSTEIASVAVSKTTVQTFVRRRLDDALQTEGRSVMNVPTAVEWGRHAETVLRYAKAHNIDLICTALAPPHFYLQKFYSAYLGRLLASTHCPILVKQSQPAAGIKDFQ
ncbi:MAG TPA: universal stress protein [Candidatus Limnocylindria bacterium]|nr:universal stress protein [Candidatus Limnocylindria bacterium]